MSPTPLVEGVGNVSRSVAAMATFWLALAKVGSCRSALSRSPTYFKHQFMLVQVGQPGLNCRLFSGELASSPCNFSFDVVLLDTSSFLLVSRQLLREGCWCSGPLRPRRYGLKHWGLVGWRRSHNRDGGHHHVARPQERGVRAHPLTRDRIVLVESVTSRNSYFKM
jgi:hypothetical protein